ncbi:MAG: TRAP transporter substrate-binding protein, partial [Sphaerochaetaceae bacterium]
MKKVLISLLMVMTAFTLSVAAQGSTESTQKAAAPVKTVTLKLSEVHAEGYPTSLADHEFARLVEEKTNG